MTWQKRTLLGIGLAIVVVGTTSVAHAQYGAPPPYAPPPGYAGYPPPPPPPPPRTGMYRTGLLFGAGIGVGGISASNCGACGAGPALEAHLGGMITPQLALMADLWGVFHSYDDGFGGSNTLSSSLFAAAAQFWATDKLWLKGGLGAAHISLSDYVGNTYGASESAVGLLGGAGFEVLQINNFALDLQFRVSHGFFDNGGATNIAFLVGANWY